MHDPVVLTDGHTYERRHIEQWLQSNDTEPVTGGKLSQKAVFANHALRNAIEEYFEQVLGEHRQAIKQSIAGLQRSTKLSSDATLMQTIDSLMQCSVLVNADLSVERVLAKIMQEAKSLVGAEVASVFLVDRRQNELYSTVNSTGGELRIPMKSGVAGAVADSGEALIIEHAYSDDRFNTEVDLKTGFRTRSILCVPIRAWKGGIIGVAQLINKTHTGVLVPQTGTQLCAEESLCFTLEDQQFLEVLAAQAGAAIVNSGMFERMPGFGAEGRWPSTPASKSPTSSLASVPDVTCSYVVSSVPSLDTIKFTAENKPPAEEVHTTLCPKKLCMVKPLLSAAVTDWQIDTLSLADLTGNRPLSTLAMHLFEHHDLISCFGMERPKLEEFLRRIERGYSATVQYHNRSHAASVLHFMHSILTHAGLAVSAIVAAGDVEDCTRQQKFIMLAGLLAAIVHDYEHEGVNNDFLVKTSNNRAVLYNDKSPNENHHVAAAWKVLQQPECSFLDCLTVKEYRQLRRLVVDLVLATDMSEHGHTLQKFKEVVSSNSDAMQGSGVGCVPASSEGAVTILKLALKCSDLGHLCLDWGSHMRWVQRLEDEFFAQGDMEKMSGMPEASFLMDREKKGVSDSQVGFFDFMVLPLFREFVSAFPSAQPMLCAVEANYQKWEEIEAALNK